MKIRLASSALALACVGALALAGSAQAQGTEGESVSGALGARADNLFARDRNQSVRERPHPEYEALGVRLGSFLAYPRVQLDVEHNSNIYAAETNAVDDVVWRVRPEVSVESNWNQHFLQVYARGAFTRYSDYGSEDTDEYDLGLSGRVDIRRSLTGSGGASFARFAEPRTSQNTPEQSAEPIEYDLAQVNAMLERNSGRLKTSVRVDWRNYDYRDGRNLAGLTVEQDDRDRAVSILTLRGDYALSPDTAIFVQGALNARDYDVASTPALAARDSDGYELLAGANFQVTQLIRGDAGVGYLSQSFDDARFEDVDGFGARARLEWFPTQLTTVTATASRIVEDSVVPGAGGFLSSSVGVQVDHELLRNLILTGQLAYAADKFKGVDREDDRWLAAISGTYLINRHIGLAVTYSYLDQASAGLDRGREFSVQRFAVSLIFQR